MTTPDATPSISMGSETRNAPATRPGPALRSCNVDRNRSLSKTKCPSYDLMIAASAPGGAG